MYDDSGELRKLTNEEKQQMLRESDHLTGVFFVGQFLKVNEGWFRVKSVKPKELRLKAIPNPLAKE